MKRKNVAKMLMLLTFLFIFMAGCKVTEKEPVTEAKEEEIADTGAIVIKSFPNLAQVYIDEEFRGDTPLTLYNLPVGQYDIIIKKEDYADFGKKVTIEVGRTEEIEATLIPLIKEEVVEEKKPVEEALPENLSARKMIKISLTSFAMYFDFEEMQLTETRTDKSDLFSRKYETYVHFAAITPAKINIINKPISEVAKEDCIFADSGALPLFSGQTLCVKTAEGSVAAISWQKTPNELEWKLLN